MDNAPKPNENWILMAFISEIINEGRFTTFQMSFMIIDTQR
jgi:hypothetical protein